MEIQTAYKKVKAMRKKAYKLMEDARELEAWILRNGGDPHPEATARRERNEYIFLAVLAGEPTREVARKFGISQSQALHIYKRGYQRLLSSVAKIY